MQPGDWLSFIGSVVGTFVSGLIAILVMIITLKDTKRDRVLTFCNQIVEESVNVIANITNATMSAQQFLTTAQKNEKTKAVKYFDIALNSLWCLKIKIDAKRKKYKYCDKIACDLEKIIESVNGLTVNNLNYVNGDVNQGKINELVDSTEYKNLLNKLKEPNLETDIILLREHVKEFYEINTEKII